MAYYQGEHFARMGHIRDNIPGRNLPSTTMPIWTSWENRPQVAGRPGFVQYRHPNEPFVYAMDSMSAGGMFLCHTNAEGNITMPVKQEYDAHWLRNMEDPETAGAFREAVTSPIIAQEWRCDNGAPVDVAGYPLTQYYTQDYRGKPFSTSKRTTLQMKPETKQRDKMIISTNIQQAE
eukprot:scaffold136388_cov34-Attheya_sp.AAC.2